MGLVAVLALSGCGSKKSTGSGIPTLRRPGSVPPIPRKGDKRTNVVFVLTDDLSTDLLRYMPHVRALARRGTEFSRYVVSDSLCCPSRSSIFTGRYPHDTGVFTNVGPDGGFGAFRANKANRSTFATSLQKAGYRTGLLGKYLNGYDPRKPEVPHGWDTWDVTNQGYDEYDYVLNVNGRPEFHRRQPSDYLTTVLQQRAVAFLDERRTDPRPFLLEVASFAPHSPSIPAPRDINKLPHLNAPRDASFGRPNLGVPPAWLALRQPLTAPQIHHIDLLYRRRARSVLAVDRLLGRLEQELDRLGIAKNTMIVFSSDNGFHMGQHRLTPGKLTPFDTDIRVPLIAAGPHIPRGRTVKALAQNVDLRPTFDQIAGAETPANVDGRSLLGLLHGDPVPKDWRNAALVEHHGPDLDPQDPDAQSAASGEPPTYESIRTGGRTYTEYRDGEADLYDDTDDPLQRRNLIETAPQILLDALHAELVRLANCHGVSCAERAR